MSVRHEPEVQGMSGSIRHKHIRKELSSEKASIMSVEKRHGTGSIQKRTAYELRSYSIRTAQLEMDRIQVLVQLKYKNLIGLSCRFEHIPYQEVTLRAVQDPPRSGPVKGGIPTPRMLAGRITIELLREPGSVEKHYRSGIQYVSGKNQFTVGIDQTICQDEVRIIPHTGILRGYTEGDTEE